MYILLVGPVGLFREGLARILRDLGESARVDCVDVSAALSRPDGSPDLLVLDGDAWHEASVTVRAVRHKWPSTRILLLMAAVDRSVAEQALAEGAVGCIEKTVTSGMLIGALRLMLAGGMYLPPSVLAPLQSGAASVPAAAVTEAADAPTSGIDNLTPRQLEVLALAARGEPNKEIARRLQISEGTVKLHLSAVYRALKVKSRGQASNAAIRMKAVVDQQVRHCLDSQLSIGRMLSNATRRHLAAGQALFRIGDPTDALYYLVRGTVHLEEIDLDRKSGSLLGEMGLFSSERRRACTVRCKTDCEFLSVTAADAMRIYYQDPEFAAYLTHLITKRLMA